MHEANVPSAGDDYVKFECENLADFEETWDRVKNEPDMTKKRLCEDMGTAWEYGFSSTAFIKGEGIRHMPDGIDLSWPIYGGSDYDLKSVMHFGSTTGSKSGCTVDKIDNCALRKLKTNGDPNGGYEVIHDNNRPSQGDVEWVKSVYPWTKD